jgi:gas vesicle protein
MSDSNDLGNFMAGLIIGGLAGAAVALLMAPQSGEETRTLIKDRSIELKDRAVEYGQDARSKAEKALEDARLRADEALEELRDRADELSQIVKERTESIQQSIKSVSDVTVSGDAGAAKQEPPEVVG